MAAELGLSDLLASTAHAPSADLARRDGDRRGHPAAGCCTRWPRSGSTTSGPTARTPTPTWAKACARTCPGRCARWRGRCERPRSGRRGDTWATACAPGRTRSRPCTGSTSGPTAGDHPERERDLQRQHGLADLRGGATPSPRRTTSAGMSTRRGRGRRAGSPARGRARLVIPTHGHGLRPAAVRRDRAARRRTRPAVDSGERQLLRGGARGRRLPAEVDPPRLARRALRRHPADLLPRTSDPGGVVLVVERCWADPATSARRRSPT